jgi:hypothetical protein
MYALLVSLTYLIISIWQLTFAVGEFKGQEINSFFDIRLIWAFNVGISIVYVVKTLFDF